MASVSDCMDVTEEDEAVTPKSQTEYQIQHFGFTPKSFTNGVYNAMLEYIKEGLCGMKEFIDKEFPGEMSTSATKEAVDRIATKLVERLDRRFDVLENYLELNVFNIPPSVMLPEDRVQTEPGCSPQESQAVDQDIQHLQSKIKALRYANMIIHHDIVDMKEMCDHFREMLDKMKRFREMASTAGVPEVKDMIVMTAEHIRSLMIEVEQLKNRDQTDG